MRPTIAGITTEVNPLHPVKAYSPMETSPAVGNVKDFKISQVAKAYAPMLSTPFSIVTFSRKAHSLKDYASMAFTVDGMVISISSLLA